MYQSLTVDGDFLDGFVVEIGHVAEVREDHEAGEQARERVHHGSDKTVPEIGSFESLPAWLR